MAYMDEVMMEGPGPGPGMAPPPMGGPGRPQFMPGPSDVPEGLPV